MARPPAAAAYASRSGRHPSLAATRGARYGLGSLGRRRCGPSAAPGSPARHRGRVSGASGTATLRRHRSASVAPCMGRDVASSSPSKRETSRRSRLAEARGALDDGVEDGLEVGRRARDDPQDLGRRRLLLQRLGQLRVVRASSQLLNSRTFSMAMTAWSAKVSSSAICLSVKGRTSAPRTQMTPIGVALAQHRHAERAFGRRDLRALAIDRVLGISPATSGDVRRSDRLGPRAPISVSVDRGATGYSRADRQSHLGVETVRRHEVKRVAVRDQDDAAVGALAEPRRRSRRWRRTPAGDRSASWQITRRISLVAVCCSSASVTCAVSRGSSPAAP